MYDMISVLNRLRSFPSTNIEFVKLDGSMRKMVATLHEETLLSKEGINSVRALESVDAFEAPSTLIAVYDVENEGFRSFYLENLVSIEGVEHENDGRNI